jgi:hypothetical protein
MVTFQSLALARQESWFSGLAFVTRRKLRCLAPTAHRKQRSTAIKRNGRDQGAEHDHHLP